MIPRAYEQAAAHPNCERRAARTNLFVLADLVAHGVANRVRVRNISATGALVEGVVLPRKGVAVTLARGDASLTGRIVWTADNRAGIRFDGRAVPGEWLPTTNVGQREVDRVVSLAKAERSAGLLPSAGRELAASSRSAADILATAALLEKLGDTLAGDPTVVVKYHDQLQVLDMATQALRAWAANQAR